MNHQPNYPAKKIQKKKSQLQVFKENQLPMIIACFAAILILFFTIGSVVTAIKRAIINREAQITAAQQAEQEQQQLQDKSALLLAQATEAASHFDYDSAIQILDGFTGDITNFPQLAQAKETYEDAKEDLIAWNDPAKIPNFSFQHLIADTRRAFSSEEYSQLFNKNFITTQEFTDILTQLYSNNYILVGINDVYTVEDDGTGSMVCKAKTLYLPAGKKPIMITQTNVNFNYYLIDSDEDKLPDKDGCGFASKLVIQDNHPLCEMVNRTGETVTGAYDLIPILDSFVETHPDFSYKGAKAVIALTGYNGLLGYRTTAEDKTRLGEDAYQAEVAQATEVANWLKNNGYTLACYTYANIACGDAEIQSVQLDMDMWQKEVKPILGTLDTFVFAQRSDISGSGAYSGLKFDLLSRQGFRYYIGFAESGTPWNYISEGYIRQGRIMVSGATLSHQSQWYNGMFDAQAILDSSRGTIPQW